MMKLDDLRKEIFLTSIFALQFGITSAQQVKLLLPLKMNLTHLK